jgi:hypothetical protein
VVTQIGALEEYREGVVQPQEAGESQAARTAHEGVHTPQGSASADENRTKDD